MFKWHILEVNIETFKQSTQNIVASQLGGVSSLTRLGVTQGFDFWFL